LSIRSEPGNPKGTSFADAVVEAGPGNSTVAAIIAEGAGGRQAVAGVALTSMVRRGTQ